jgi:hypothetical protein
MSGSVCTVPHASPWFVDRITTTGHREPVSAADFAQMNFWLGLRPLPHLRAPACLDRGTDSRPLKRENGQPFSQSQQDTSGRGAAPHALQGCVRGDLDQIEIVRLPTTSNASESLPAVSSSRSLLGVVTTRPRPSIALPSRSVVKKSSSPGTARKCQRSPPPAHACRGSGEINAAFLQVRGVASDETVEASSMPSTSTVAPLALNSATTRGRRSRQPVSDEVRLGWDITQGILRGDN